MKAEIEPGAFITCESGEEGYRVVIRCSSMTAAHKAHRAVLTLAYEVQAAMEVPNGWRVQSLNDSGVNGYQIGAPEIRGVRSNTSIWEDSKDPAEQLLYQMLASRKGVES